MVIGNRSGCYIDQKLPKHQTQHSPLILGVLSLLDFKAYNSTTFQPSVGRFPYKVNECISPGINRTIVLHPKGIRLFSAVS